MSAAVFAGLLRDLHQVLRGYAGPIVPLGSDDPPLSDISLFLNQIDSGKRLRGLLTTGDVTAMHAQLTRMLPATEGDGQPIHGDANPGNLIASDRGWLWSDFEEACRGPVGWDLASFARTRAFDPEAAWAFYGEINRGGLEEFRKLRGLHGLVWWLMYAERDSDADRRVGASEVAGHRLEAWRAGA
jgi:thiamine kinase-like enzyme